MSRLGGKWRRKKCSHRQVFVITAIGFWKQHKILSLLFFLHFIHSLFNLCVSSNFQSLLSLRFCLSVFWVLVFVTLDSHFHSFFAS